MRKIVGWSVITAVVAIIFGCASDIILEEPPSLKGTYKGRYIVTTLGENPVERIQNIDCVFEDIAFHIDVNEDNYNADFCICNVDGSYSLEDKVRMDVSTSLPPGYQIQGSTGNWCPACDDQFDPEGAFDLIRKQDSVILTYQDTAHSLLKEIKVVPATE